MYLPNLVCSPCFSRQNLFPLKWGLRTKASFASISEISIGDYLSITTPLFYPTLREMKKLLIEIKFSILYHFNPVNPV